MAKRTYSRIDIVDYVRAFLLELAVKEKRPFIVIDSLAQAERVTGLLNLPENTTFKSLANIHSGYLYWLEQRVEYVRSNLGRGFIFYFICNRCDRRTRYLYHDSPTISPTCRLCCRITYRRSSALGRNRTPISYLEQR